MLDRLLPIILLTLPALLPGKEPPPQVQIRPLLPLIIEPALPSKTHYFTRQMYYADRITQRTAKYYVKSKRRADRKWFFKQRNTLRAKTLSEWQDYKWESVPSVITVP